MYWCLGHLGIQENELVGMLAKEAACSRVPSTHTLRALSLSKLRQKTRTNYQSLTLPSLDKKARMKFKSNPSLVLKAIDNLEKGLVAII
ncbi:hypothetical protein O181_011489 [Austropuccinia psidii MF-1]|uniref:Uncharacterized protein n=1 Tax=Austropuccinia psidii MF-1 TaxID=1389203 RepID=A0A9Q3GLW9_9BASI|nr:hypothetical protein [Austropuccinia psidii MF-1]